MKYAVEVAKVGSINKASETLLIAQPNLSKAIKHLEANLGITLFYRSSQGMILTPEGAEFIGYAEKILKQVDEIEQMYRNGKTTKQRFSISVPRASYISEAFARFSACVSSAPAEIYYNETNSFRAIQNILDGGYKLGIIRYASNHDNYFAKLLGEKGLAHVLVSEFHYVIVMSKASMLTSLAEIRFSDLKSLIEIAHADPFVPSLPLAEVKREELPDDIERRVFVFERASQFDLLSSNADTFMWVSPIPKKLLSRWELVQRSCADNHRIYRDVLIYRSDYKLSELDQRFVAELGRARKLYLA